MRRRHRFRQKLEAVGIELPAELDPGFLDDEEEILRRILHKLDPDVSHLHIAAVLAATVQQEGLANALFTRDEYDAFLPAAVDDLVEEIQSLVAIDKVVQRNRHGLNRP